MAMKVKCPECKEAFDLSINDYDEGDDVFCPECNEVFIITVKSGRFKLVTDKEKYFDENLELFEEED